MKPYHPLSEKIVDVLTKKVNNNNRHFFRILTAYYLAKVASMMRCNIQTKDRGVIPVNAYVCNLMVSGTGKGHSTNIMERDFIGPFKREFLSKVFPLQAESNLATLSVERGNENISNGSILSLAEEVNKEKELLDKQFTRLGELAFSFDSATTPAVKQMREKLLLANAGSMNLELDEIGSNLSANADVLTAFLELYDVGMIKQKLIKNTIDNVRSKELHGATPTNLMMFGTPTKLLDGGRTEDEFRSFLETGYARRLLFGYSTENNRPRHLTAEERYRQMTDTSVAADTQQIQHLFESFAKRPFNSVLTMTEANSIYLIEYQMKCEEEAEEFKEHMAVNKAEIIHRYYKVMKLAGAYAFADNSNTIEQHHLDAAISLVEDSGEQFQKMLERKGSHERLAHYLADVGVEVTQHEMLDDLPFYRGTEMQRKDMMTLAMSYGYRNNIVIRHREQDGIAFYSGESLKESDLDALHVSISGDIVTGYQPDIAPFNKLHKLTTAKGYHYTAHSFINGYRSGDNAIPGFDILIIDCDGTVSIETAKMMMADYTFLLSTTKRHSDQEHRFRMILPITHKLKLDTREYSKFMENVFEWLPFEVDTSAKDIARKWESFPGHHEYNFAETLDATMFIPHTKKSDETKAQLDAEGLSNMERWFKNNTEKGNRAVNMYRYGMVLVDAGKNLGEIIEKLESFNQSLSNPLAEEELRNSTLKSISKELKKRGQI